MRLELLCSASTAGLRGGMFPIADEPLDQKGRVALARLAGRLADYDRILASPALSAAETAKGLMVAATPEPALRDGDFGRWAGRALAEIEALEPEALALWLRNAGVAPHGGESFADVAKRVGQWMDSLPEKSGAVLAITHAAVLRAAIVHALGAPALSLLRIDLSPLSRVYLSGSTGRWRLSGLIPVKHAR